MIHVDRLRKENSHTIKPAESWLKAAGKKTKQAVKDGPSHKISNLYRDPRVKMALEKLFYDKCAYCESSLYSVEWEVEHYRPKGSVAENVDHNGYYWLAYKWENLYPACKYCNQRRKERPLLLDPCGDDPEPHFKYDIQGQIHPSEPGDIFAEATIRICHLSRRRLRDHRARKILWVSKLLDTIQKSKKAENKEVEEELLNLLDDFIAPASEFAAVARAVVQNPSAF